MVGSLVAVGVLVGVGVTPGLYSAGLMAMFNNL